MPAELKMAKSHTGHQGGAGQSATLTGVGNPSPALHDRTAANFHPGPLKLPIHSKLLAGGTQQPGSRNVSGDGGNQRRSPKRTFNSQKPDMSTPGKAEHPGKHRHTHILCLTPRASKNDFFHCS